MNFSKNEDNLIPDELWQVMLEQMPFAVSYKNRELVYVWGNHHFLADAGLGSLDDLLGKKDGDLPWTPAQTARFRDMDQEAIRSNKSISNSEEQRTVADGQLIWMEQSTIPISDEADQVIGLLGVYRDITSHKQAQEDLPASQTIMNLIMDNSPQAIFWKDHNSTFLGGNRNFALQAGLSNPEELIGKNDYQVAWGEQADHYKEMDRRVMEADTPEYQIVEPQTRSDGSVAWLNTTKIPFHNAQDEVIGIFCAYEDITERVETEQKLQEANARIERLLQEQSGQSKTQMTETVPLPSADSKQQAMIDAMPTTSSMLNSDLLNSDLIDEEEIKGARVVQNDVVQNDKTKIDLAKDTTDSIVDRLEDLIKEQSEKLQTQTMEIAKHELAEREQQTLIDALRSTAAVLNSTLDLDEVLDRILSEIGRVVPHDGANVVLIEGDVARIVRVKSKPDHLPTDHELDSKVLFSQLPNHQHIIKGKHPFIIQDTAKSGLWVEQPHSSWIRSYIGVPIYRDDNAIGLINLNSATPGYFGPRHAEQLQAFAYQAAIAIENARLYKGAQELATLQERQRLARDLHDAVSQTLFTASLLADVLPTLWLEDRDEGMETLQNMHRLTQGALAEMRMLLVELRPAALINSTLSELLQQLAAAAMSRKLFTITLRVDDDIKLLPDVQVSLYRLAQEALNNVIKHSHATEVVIVLVGDAHHVELSIRDNGRGFDLTNRSDKRLGLGIMQERADAIRASFDIDTSHTSGTAVTVLWPNPI